MNNNEILRRLRYELNLSDAKMIEIFARVGQVLNEAEVHSLLGKEDEEGTVICLDDLMAAFLDSLIVELRGPPRPGSPPPAIPDRISNNDIIKKVRIALKLQEADMMAILEAGGQPMSKGELSALFRKPGHKHYRACGDQVMRAFLRGLTLRLRPSK